MTKLFLTMTLALCTVVASAQFSAITTITSVEEENETTYNVTDKLGVGYQVSEKLLVGLTRNGEDDYNLLGRYALMNGVWGTAVYNYVEDYVGDSKLMDNLSLGLGYSFKVWDELYIDPNYTMPAKADADGEREGSFNLSVSYKF
jgi:hypothetical protein